MILEQSNKQDTNCITKLIMYIPWEGLFMPPRPTVLRRGNCGAAGGGLLKAPLKGPPGGKPCIAPGVVGVALVPIGAWRGGIGSIYKQNQNRTLKKLYQTILTADLILSSCSSLATWTTKIYTFNSTTFQTDVDFLEVKPEIWIKCDI